MLTFTLDNQTLTVPEGTTILTAAQGAGVAIPTLCHLPGHAPRTSCFVCVVRVQGRARLVPACATHVEEGMVVESETPEVQAARRTALELLLGEHLGDCLAPCTTVCPVHVDIPGVVRALLATGDLRAAHRAFTARLPFPALISRLCPAPCEKGCRRAQQDHPVGIRALERAIGDAGLADVPARQPSRGLRVAIVGAGPAGMAAASALQRAGVECTVYDDHDAPGGGLRGLVPDAVLDAELAVVWQQGATFRPRTRLGVEVTLDTLRADYAAVVLATGEAPADVPVEPTVVVAHATGHTRMAVRALAAGAAAAHAVLHALTGAPLPAPHPFSVHMGRLDTGELAAFSTNADPPALTGDADDPAALAREARRCLQCDCRGYAACRLRQHAEAYHAAPLRYREGRRRYTRDASHPEVLYEPGKCIACGLCVSLAAAERDTLGLTFIGRGFDVRVAVPFDAPLSAGLAHLARACATACPTGALELVEG